MRRRLTLSERDPEEGDFAFGFYDKIRPGINQNTKLADSVRRLYAGAVVGKPATVTVVGYCIVKGQRMDFNESITFIFREYKNVTEAIRDNLKNVLEKLSPDALVLKYVEFSQ